MRLGNKLSILVVLSIGAAGCADGNKVVGPRRAAPDAPAYDGSGWAGSGNRSETDSTSAAAGIGWVASGNLTVTDSATTQTGTGWAGSGN